MRKPSELVFLLYDLPSFASFGYSLHFVVEDFELYARAVTLRPLRKLFQAARDI